MSKDQCRLALPVVVLVLATGHYAAYANAKVARAKQVERVAAKPHLLPVSCPNGHVPADAVRRCVPDTTSLSEKQGSRESIKALASSPRNISATSGVSTVSPSYSAVVPR
jgi:hypothetical protein